MTPQPNHAEYYRALIHTCLEAGANIVRRLTEEADTAAEARTAALPPAQAPAPLPEIAAAFAHVNRAIRQGILLAQSLDRPSLDNQSPDRAPPRPTRAAARETVIRRVEDQIQQFTDPAESTTLHREFRDRLDRPDFDADLNNRPIDDIITEIVRDLGLSADIYSRPHKRRTPDDLDILRARAAAPPGGASNPALPIAWPPRPKIEGIESFPPEVQAILNPTRWTARIPRRRN